MPLLKAINKITENRFSVALTTAYYKKQQLSLFPAFYHVLELFLCSKMIFGTVLAHILRILWIRCGFVEYVTNVIVYFLFYIF